MGVGQLIDKLFGGSAVQNEAVLCAYGKLPFYAEYRRLEVSPGTPTAYSQWLDEGRLAWVRSSMKSDNSSTRSSRLLIMLPGAKEVVVASVWDSRDNLGRIFPFSFFITCPPEALGADPVERWVAAAAVHRAFDRLYSLLHTLASGGNFYKRFKKHMITLKPTDFIDRVKALREDAAGIEVEQWFKGLMLGDETNPAEWFGGLLHRVERWKNQDGAGDDMALGCPLAQGVPFSAQVVVWLDWLENLYAKSGKSPGLILPMNDEKNAPDLMILLRDPLPDDYQLLTTDARAYGYVEHLAAIPESNCDAAPSAEPPTGSLATWLKKHAP